MDARVKEEVTILIADDDEGHRDLIKTHLEDSGICNPILEFKDGQEIWDFLQSDGSNAANDGKGRALLLLLDIRMPKMDGVEVLRRIKMHPFLRILPVIILTTTDDPKEMEACYSLGCNCYITKPVDSGRFAETLRRLGLFIQILRVGKISKHEKHTDC